MNTVKLRCLATEIAFAPKDISDDFEIYQKQNRSLTGKLRIRRWYRHRKWIVEIEFMSKTDADNINDWWEGGYQCIFYPDLVNSPSSYYYVKILNKIKPLAKFILPYWQDRFYGSLNLGEST